ncbi:peptidoglycan-recognition protein LB-like [Aricia agestis]|uniref:peptidoglycan-recognition protein LB-like n=1 Tax=Aricia agestis TaxID=91739 RepID=UPI001C20B714|nr:peptidoglycan-recognition protein LB-like [Aricia agestis]XP_041971439.1 peptidoglycan-recognition protein LB-like [Aricia agestis]
MPPKVLPLLLCIFASVHGFPRQRRCVNHDDELKIISREQWHARPPAGVTPLARPAPLVIIHHSYYPGACNTTEQCADAMRHMQDMHQIDNQWVDIGYNFGVGGDGLVYEGRGWHAVGAHAAGYNSNSIGIVLIGNWVYSLPPANQMGTVRKLIQTGIELGHISPDYTLIGHRQVSATECPGQALFDEIQTWDKFEKNFKL